MKTVDVSGMGGGYENECQKMLKAGIEFLIKDPGEIKFKEYKNIYGIIDTSDDNRTAKLEKHIADASGDCTGGMVHCVMQHLWFISTNNKKKWLEEFKDQPERIFEWDGTENSCPKTDISESFKNENR